MKNEEITQLYKTDYDNMADLSKFVSEYKKAQQMIKECNDFYRSFLRSKLLTYTQLTNTIYKKQKNKFYTYEPYQTNYDENIFNDDFFKNFNIPNVFKKSSFHSFFDGILGIVRYAAFMETYYDMKHINEYIELVTNEAFDFNIYFKLSGNNLSRYRFQNEGKNITINNDEFKSKKDYLNFCEKISNDFEKEFYIHEKEWLQSILEYFDYNIYINFKIDYTYLINDISEALSTAAIEESGKKPGSKDKIYEQFNKTINDLENGLKQIVKVNMSDYLSHEEIYDIFKKYLPDNLGEVMYFSKNSFYSKIKNNEKLDNDIYEQISDSIRTCQNILEKYSAYDNNNLYFIDDKNKVHFFCKDSELKDIDISIENDKLICQFINETCGKYNRFSSSQDICKTLKVLTFDINTNMLISYNEHENNYTEIIKYKYKNY